jgi:hypothetical protein
MAAEQDRDERESSTVLSIDTRKMPKAYCRVSVCALTHSKVRTRVGPLKNIEAQRLYDEGGGEVVIRSSS